MVFLSGTIKDQLKLNWLLFGIVQPFVVSGDGIVHLNVNNHLAKNNTVHLAYCPSSLPVMVHRATDMILRMWNFIFLVLSRTFRSSRDRFLSSVLVFSPLTCAVPLKPVKCAKQSFRISIVIVSRRIFGFHEKSTHFPIFKKLQRRGNSAGSLTRPSLFKRSKLLASFSTTLVHAYSQLSHSA